MNNSSVRRTQESGSRVMRQRMPSTLAPRRRPKVYQSRSAARQPAMATATASHRLSRPAPARAPMTRRSGTAGRGTPA